MLYVPPRQTHIVLNRSETEPAEYVVARDSPTEDSVEVPWASEGERAAGVVRAGREARNATSSAVALGSRRVDRPRGGSRGAPTRC